MSLTVSIMTGGANNHPTTSEEANGLATDFVSEGIIGAFTNTSGVAPATGAFSVNAQGTPDMTVAVGSGIAYVTGTPSSQVAQTFRVNNSASANTTISANASGSTKYDWVYIKLDATLLNAPTLAGTTTATIVTSRSTSQTSDDGTPPTFGYPIAVVTVANGASSITNAMIRDLRGNAGIGTVTGVNTNWETGILPVPNTVTYNGNNNYDLVFNSINLTTYISAGMRLRTSRAIPAPTQCTNLNGTTQYFIKTSPNKMTFTDDFTVGAWIKLAAYPSGATSAPIISRINTTQGWWFGINATGQVTLSGHNAALTNFTRVVSRQSVPLNKWVYVAAELDMSAATVSATTCYTMINGIDVPATVVQGGTNPSALVQAGDLSVGTYGAAAEFFSGKIAQVAVFNAKVTQATMRGYVAQGLAGSETSIASGYSFNNSITDLNTTTPNDLSVGGGAAVATNADSPFGGQADGTVSSTLDYAIVGATTFSTNTTLNVQVPDGCTIPTSGGVSAVAYSGVKAPYNMPIQKGKWRVQTLVKTGDIQSSPTASTWYNPSPTTSVSGGNKLTIPIGEWFYGYEVLLLVVSASSNAAILSTLSTASNTESDKELTTEVYQHGTVATTLEALGPVKKEKELSLAVATPVFLNIESTVASMTSIQMLGNTSTTKIYADNAYL